MPATCNCQCAPACPQPARDHLTCLHCHLPAPLHACLPAPAPPATPTLHKTLTLAILLTPCLPRRNFPFNCPLQCNPSIEQWNPAYSTASILALLHSFLLDPALLYDKNKVGRVDQKGMGDEPSGGKGACALPTLFPICTYCLLPLPNEHPWDWACGLLLPCPLPCTQPPTHKLNVLLLPVAAAIPPHFHPHFRFPDTLLPSLPATPSPACRSLMNVRGRRHWHWTWERGTPIAGPPPSPPSPQRGMWRWRLTCATWMCAGRRSKRVSAGGRAA